jgi:threonyl-tRNA synthetase
MVHRSVLSTMGRLVALLLERYDGAFPLWLSPVQANILPISDDQIPYARQVADALRVGGLRVEVDDRSSERLSAKIRDAGLRRIPYCLVVGKREAQDGTASLRVRGGGDLGAMALADIIARLRAQRDAKVLDLIEP